MPEPLKQRVATAAAALRAYDYGKPIEPVAAFETLASLAGEDPEAGALLRQELAAILDSDASLAVKQAACKQLWILGPGTAMPAVVRLLDAKDPRMAEAALIAIARSPSREADTALRNGLARMQGGLLIATASLIGDRGDQEAANALTRVSTHSDPAVAAAARVALEKLAWAKDATTAESGFATIFDGRTLDGWVVDTPGLWSARNGVLIGRTQGLTYNDFLRTGTSFGDFTLRLKMRLLRGYGNSGVQFRSKPVPDSHELSGYQADAAKNLWGTLYDESRRRKTLADPGQDFHDRIDVGGWHDYEITAQGAHVVLKLDNRVTVDYVERDSAIERSGLIALQVHADRRPVEVWFREIRIRT